MKILIIEDEDIKYNHIKNYLNKLGETNITRKISRNGALKHIADKYDNNESYDLIICDNYMPIYDNEPMTIKACGLFIAEHIKHRYGNKFTICICSSGKLDEGKYDFSIAYDSSIDLTEDFEMLLNMVKKHYNTKGE